ncbi:RNA-binding protein Puf3 [Schizosaccharomyces cryophilus OY26]|uniref:Pumilio homology domain family member 3 n=1 Tax=Schizosaccharomyces cryophilus (strain OY26 / ATCC MYA-4695 / CBS 11777 / NBRC 106824 / NRRL Y48691) TaxID=653667 RepID=S9XAG3_SCHCR|nr:RNA-binding protein Puf3 [Schizosaccharomyces cryophilus OY26]EPY50751.1 RNA-binding protein Puf3 [Schizosaccharomyces cryophilus OY26]
MYATVKSNAKVSDGMSENAPFNFSSGYTDGRPSLISSGSPRENMISSLSPYSQSSGSDDHSDTSSSFLNPFPSFHRLSMNQETADTVSLNSAHPFRNKHLAKPPLSSLTNLQDPVFTHYPANIESPFHSKGLVDSSNKSNALNQDTSSPSKVNLYGQLGSDSGVRFPQSLQNSVPPLKADLGRTLSSGLPQTPSSRILSRHTRAHSDFWKPVNRRAVRHTSHSSIGDMASITQAAPLSGTLPNYKDKLDVNFLSPPNVVNERNSISATSPTLASDISSSSKSDLTSMPLVSNQSVYPIANPTVKHNALDSSRSYANINQDLAPVGGFGSIPIDGISNPYPTLNVEDQLLKGSHGHNYFSQSKLLHVFHNNKKKRFELSDILGNVVLFSSDQYGSRFIQQKLATATEEEKSAVFEEIISSNCLQLMMDIFGNYVIQKFLEYGTDKQKTLLVSKIKGHTFVLAVHMYGCRVVQKAIEHIATEQQVEIVSELDGHVLECVCDQNGNHVIQKSIECIDSKKLGFVFEALRPQIHVLSAHPYGCRVIQRVIEKFTYERQIIIDDLLPYSLQLTQGQYGNYVVQHILKKGTNKDKNFVFKLITKNLLYLSCHKFASNVVERCISYISENDRAYIIQKVLTEKVDNVSILMLMMKDKYANYVVQKLLEASNEKERELLISYIYPHISTLKKYTYGKHLIMSVERYRQNPRSENSKETRLDKKD